MGVILYRDFAAEVLAGLNIKTQALTIHVVSRQSGKPAIASAATQLLQAHGLELLDRTHSHTALTEQEFNSILEGTCVVLVPFIIVFMMYIPRRQRVSLSGFNAGTSYISSCTSYLTPGALWFPSMADKAHRNIVSALYNTAVKISFNACFIKLSGIYNTKTRVVQRTCRQV